MDSQYVAPFDSELANCIVAFPFILLRTFLDFIASTCQTIMATICAIVSASISIVSMAMYAGVCLHMQLLKATTRATVNTVLRLVLWLLPPVLSTIRFLLYCMVSSFRNWPASTSAVLGIAAFIYIASNPRVRGAVRARLTGLFTTVLARTARDLDNLYEECLITYSAWQRTRLTPAKIPTSPPPSLPSTPLKNNETTPPPPCSPYPFFTTQPSPPSPPSPSSLTPSPSRYEHLQALEQYHWATKTGPYTDWARSYRPPSQRFPFAPAPSPPGSPPGSSPPGTPHPHPTSLFPPGHWLLETLSNSSSNTTNNNIFTNASTNNNNTPTTTMTTTATTGLGVDFSASIPPMAALAGGPAPGAAPASALPATPSPAAPKAASAPSSVLAAAASAAGSGTVGLARAVPTFSWSAGGGGLGQRPAGAPVFATK
ncbi:uncharacterized protein LTHEOB_9894 [Neofusicoccum parvum]|nr:uncharacterized protein LTHEOB_9894 [Neofusicoccum parvum]